MTVLAVTGSAADWGWLEPIVTDLSKYVDVMVLVLGPHEVQSMNGHVQVRRSSCFSGQVDLNMTEYLVSVITAVDQFLCAEDDHGVCYSEAIVIGDRIEMFGAASVIASHKIRLHHLYAGDVSGCIDDKYRDAISMLADVLYTGTLAAQTRAEQLAVMRSTLEGVHQCWFPFTVDQSVFDELPDVSPGEYIMARFHPETSKLNPEPVEEWIEDVMQYAKRDNMTLLVWPPNNDDGADVIRDIWESHGIEMMSIELSRPKYLALLRNAYAIYGNSSSFVLEVPLVRNDYRAVTLYGNRQKGRSGDVGVELLPKVAEVLRKEICDDCVDRSL